MSGILAKTSVLSELGDEERSSLLDFLEARQIDEGGVLFHTGDESSEMYVVVEGAIRIEIEGEEATRMLPGDVLGAVSLVRAGGRSCAAIAAETTRLLVLTRTSYFRLRSDFPSLALALQEGILRQLSGELHTLLDRD